MNEVIEKALNRGAPIDTPILININELLHTLDNKDLYQDYRKNITNVVSKISNIIDFFGGEIALPIYATISMSENNSKVLQFSGENIFANITELLKGIDIGEVLDACCNLEKFYTLRDRVLRINSPEELKVKLPYLYDLYIEQIELNEKLLELKSMVDDPKVPIELKLSNVSRITNGFKELYSNFDLKREQQFAKDFTLKLFLERMMNVVTLMLSNFEEILEIYDDPIIELDSFLEDDADKLNLFIATQFMDKIESVEPNEQQRYLFYLTNYFKDNVETKVTRVKIKLNDHKITPITLYERYKRVLTSNPELLAINFSPIDFRNMSKEEVEEFITAYLAELSANWELIPSDDVSVEKSIRNCIKRKYRKISEEERKLKEERLLSIYLEKKKFYDSTDPYFRIRGKQTFDGYVGYIYPNSLVVLEKFYDNAEKKKIADNQAIYILSMKDFYDLSQHSKLYLIANHLCSRVIHKRNWQERVLKYINTNNEESSPVEDTHKLIRENKVVVVEKKL